MRARGCGRRRSGSRAPRSARAGRSGRASAGNAGRRPRTVGAAARLLRPAFARSGGLWPAELVANPVDRARVGAEDQLQPLRRVRVTEVLERELALDRDECRGVAVEVEGVAVGGALDLA